MTDPRGTRGAAAPDGGAADGGAPRTWAERQQRDWGTSDHIVVVATKRSARPEPELEVQVVNPDGTTVAWLVPDDAVDAEARTLDVRAAVDERLYEPLGVRWSQRDGLGALLSLAGERPIHLPLVEPGVRVGGLRSTTWTIGIDPRWSHYPRIVLGAWASERPPEAMPGATERPPPTPALGDTGAWPDGLEDWLVDLDARLRLDPAMTATDYRAIYSGDRFTDEPLDPAMEEALRVRDVPGHLPPPEPLPSGRPLGGAVPRGADADLPSFPIDNQVAIVDRPDREQLLVPFAGGPTATRGRWDELAAQVEALSGGLVSTDPERGCLGWRWSRSLVVFVIVALLLGLLVGGYLLATGDDDQEPAAPSSSEQPEEDPSPDEQAGARAIAVEDYAGLVCLTLDDLVSAPSEGFATVLDEFRSAQPQTVEEAQVLYTDLEIAARDLSQGLGAAAADLEGGPVPDVDDGEAVNEAAVATYQEAADALEELAQLAGAFDPATADQADAQAFADEVNRILGELEVLGTEFEGAPEVQAAVDADPACSDTGG